MSPHNVAVKLSFVLGLVTVMSACQNPSAPVSTASTERVNAQPAYSFESRSGKEMIADQYIVVFRDGYTDVEPRAKRMVAGTKGKLRHTFKNGLKGFAAGMTADEAAALSADPSVAYVEQDQVASGQGGQGGKGTSTLPAGTLSQPSARWNLDRLDQAALPLNSTYTYAATGAGVNVYIVDAGIRTTHVEFGGRAVGDTSVIDDGYGTAGCTWHGTHVAGTTGGLTVGVAKESKLHSVRVLDCNDQGSWSGVIAGIDWIVANRVLPAVINISISGGFSQTVNDAVERAIASGITVVVAAGNYSGDACNYSPASAPNAITVGMTGSRDNAIAQSNFGTCVDIMAPGENVVSAWNSSDTWLDSGTGTSMAAPHVAGAAALYLEKNPAATPAMVRASIIQMATLGKVRSLGLGTPNLLLRTR